MGLGWLLATFLLALGAPYSAPHGSAGCVGVPRSQGARPVADAIAAVRTLSALSAQIGAAGLGAELNGRPHVTVFAPTNRALGALSLDPSVLRYHIVPERIAPDHLVGTHHTLHGAPLSVARSAARLRVNAAAGLICTRVQAANGNVYLIDAVLTPR